jgi:hypothetical protein
VAKLIFVNDVLESKSQTSGISTSAPGYTPGEDIIWGHDNFQGGTKYHGTMTSGRPTAQVQKFSQNLGSTSKFYAP